MKKLNLVSGPLHRLGLSSCLPLMMFSWIGAGQLCADTVTLTHLRCENLNDPLGIDVAKPRLSWIIESNRSNEKQTAYQVVVEGQWDSGRVASDQSINVEYGGKDLAPTTRYSWKVRVWDAEGKTSEWSKPALFSTGLKEWSAKWIGDDKFAGDGPLDGAQWIWFPEADPAQSAPPGIRYFRRTITLPAERKVTKATCVITADNTFELSVNGQKVGQGENWHQPATLDITSLLHAETDNKIAVTATNTGDGPSPAGLIAKLHIEFSQGDPLDIVTDGQWEASTDPNESWATAQALGAGGITPGGIAPPLTRLPITDQGVVLRHGDGPGQCDELGARDVWVWEDHGTYYMHYDGAGPKGWLACLATSTDLTHWTKKGPVLDLGAPGSEDSASASYGTTYWDGTTWHMFYLGTPHASPAPDRVPSPPYLTMKARSDSPSGPWMKEPNVVPFRPGDMNAANYGASSIVVASPGMIVKSGDEYLMFFSWGGYAAKTGRGRFGNIDIARTHDLEGKWTIDPEPMLPGDETCENASLYFEPTNKTWFLFTNHIGGDYTVAVWVYWTQDINKWDPANKAVVLDGSNCTWSKKCIGLPSVLKVGNRLAVFYDAPGGDSTSHMNRDVGLAWLQLPLESPTRRRDEGENSSWMPAKVLGAFGIAPWGTAQAGDDQRRLPARYLRKEFAIAKKVTRATAYVCGLGFFDLFLNGAKISDDVMDPALSDYTKADYYVTFDVTNQVKQGANAIGVILGNGRFYAPRPSVPAPTQTFGYPKLLLQLEVEYDDGTKTTLVSDENWRLTTNGPIRANNEYDGEEYDARMEMPGWNTAGFDDKKWEQAQVVSAPGGTLKAQMIEPMRVTQVIHPVGITSPRPGTYIVDMGQNFYGTVRLKASAPAGTRVSMTSAYSLKPDGTLKTADNRSARATDVYIFKGVGTEVWNPRFKGQGYRRVQVTGFPGALTVDNFEGFVIHTDAEPAGEFQCSNDLINRIHTAIWWGMRMYMRSAPLDPDRDERQAWTGDPAKDAESEAYNYNVAPFYAKWMDDVERSQRGDGTIPDVAMYWVMGSGVEWPSVFTIIPDWFIDFYGDRRVAAAHYDAMKKWVLAMMQKNGLPDGTLKAASYGDWCDTYTIGGKVSDKGQTPRDLVSTAYQYNNCRIVERLAELMGKTDDEGTFTAMADKLKTAFNQKFLNPATHTYQGETQCGYVLALKFGLVPDDQRDAVIAHLVDDILVKHNGHLSVGLIGMQWLMQTLTDIGRSDVAWTIATQTTRPSWGYMLSKGATTIWERWDYDTRGPGMNSEALLMQAGNLDAWFYQTLAGIRPAAPGFKKILIAPSIVGDLTWVKAHFDSPYGRIVSNWKIGGNQLTMDVTIPANTTATVVVPGKNGGSHEVGSGLYHFTSQWSNSQ